MSQIDLLLLHPPSVYDFRQKAIMYGPVSDLIPSSPVFEMYPLGFLTITNYLEERGYHVRIVNLALRMMNDRRFDVPAFLAKLKPRAVGIDLHWLPHAHGAIEVAKIVNQMQEGTEKPRHKVEFVVGEFVRVKEGPFTDFNGSVEDVNYEKSKVRVAVTIFGRSTPVELEFSQIEKT